MKTILFTNSRDELRLLEWVSHHINIGFDCIYIHDHKSDIPINTFIKNHSKIIIENIENVGKKPQLIDKCVNYAKLNNYDWMLYLDLDEFLVLPNDNNIKTFLLKYDNFDLIGINWLMFGSNFHINEPSGTMLENYTRCNKYLDRHIKSFVRPNKVLKTLNAHVYDIIDFSKAVGIDYSPIEISCKHHHLCKYSDIQDKDFLTNNAFIAHYYTQSWENYYARKIRYPPDDKNCVNRKIYNEEEIYKLYNNIIFTFIYEKYDKINKITITELIK